VQGLGKILEFEGFGRGGFTIRARKEFYIICKREHSTKACGYLKGKKIRILKDFEREKGGF